MTKALWTSLFVMLAACLPISAVADPPTVFSVRNLLEASVGGHSDIQDLLIDDTGQVTGVIVAPVASIDAGAWPRQVPWSDIRLSGGVGRAGTRQMVANTDVDALRQMPPFPGPVAGTLGGPNAVLASKLLAASVKNRLGSDVGTLQDVIVNENGRAQTVLIATAQEVVHAPWAQVSVQPDGTSLNVPGGPVEAVLIWNR